MADDSRCQFYFGRDGHGKIRIETDIPQEYVDAIKNRDVAMFVNVLNDLLLDEENREKLRETLGLGFISGHVLVNYVDSFVIGITDDKIMT